MSLLIDMAESGLMPDRLIRLGIRQLDRKRLRVENHGQNVQQRSALDDFISEMNQSPIAIKTHSVGESSLWPARSCGVTVTAGSGWFPIIF